MPRRLIVPLIVLLLWPSVSSAQEPPPEQVAENHYQTAVRLFGEGRYREALDEFDAAIAVRPESVFYCNRAIALIQLGEMRGAFESLETCQETFTGGPEQLAAIDAQRQAVGAFVGHIRPSSLDTVSGINAPTPDDSAGWTKASSGVVLIGIGGAFLASAATLDVLSADLKEAFVEESSGPRGSSEESYQDLRDRYVARQRIWIGLTAAGGVLTLSGITLLTLHLMGRTSEEGVEVGAMATDGPGLSLRWRW